MPETNVAFDEDAWLGSPATELKVDELTQRLAEFKTYEESKKQEGTKLKILIAEDNEIQLALIEYIIRVELKLKATPELYIV